MAAGSSTMNDRVQAYDPDDPEVIRRSIAATRADMADTIDAIQEKLNPKRIKDEAVESVRQATVGRVEVMADDAKWKVKGAGEDVIETIKRNPAPALLAAVGLGWLFMESRGRSSEREMSRYRYRGQDSARYQDTGRYYYAGQRSGRGEYDYDYDEFGRRSMGHGEPSMHYQQQGGLRERAGQVQQVAGQAASRVQDAAETAASKVQDVTSTAASKVQDVAGSAAGKVQDVAESAADTASQVVSTAKQGVQQAAYEAQYRAERVGSRFGEMMQENPLIIGAAAVALGAVIGFAFPSTQKESELMGEARDRLMEKAQEAVSDTAQKVQRVAQEATSAAKEAVKSEAEKQNLGSGLTS